MTTTVKKFTRVLRLEVTADEAWGKTQHTPGEKQVDRYGLGRPLGTFDPIYANFCHADRVLPTIGWSFIFRRRLVRHCDGSDGRLPQGLTVQQRPGSLQGRIAHTCRRAAFDE